MIKGLIKGAAGLGLTAAGAACILASAGAAHAQAGLTSSGTTTANVGVNATITLSGLTGSFTLTGNPNTTQSQNGAVTANVLTNNRTGYTVSVQASGATLAGAATGNTDTIPIANLKARETGTTTFNSLSNTAALTVHNQAGKSASTGDTVSTDYQIAIPFVNSDTYSTTITETATTQ